MRDHAALFRSVMVTGGAGFIGSRLVARLAEIAGKVTVLDNLHPQVHGLDARVPVFPARVDFHRMSVENREAVEELVRSARPALVYHLAAETGTGQSYDEIARYCQVNVSGTAHLIEAVRRSGDPSCRVVLAGSRAVYGEGAYRASSGELVVPPPRLPASMAVGDFLPALPSAGPLQPVPTPETIPLKPSSVYASTKLMQELLVAQGLAGTNCKPVLLRFQNVYGAGQSLRNPYTGVLSIFCQQILSGKTLDIFEDGEIVRDFVHVDDVVEALMVAGRSEQPGEAPINIGSGHAATIADVAKRLLALLGASEDRCRITGAFRAGDIRHAVADISKAREQLGWQPRVELGDGLRELADWARSSLSIGG